MLDAPEGEVAERPLPERVDRALRVVELTQDRVQTREPELAATYPFPADGERRFERLFRRGALVELNRDLGANRVDAIERDFERRGPIELTFGELAASLAREKQR